MNTLPKEVWYGFFDNKEHYLEMRKAWASAGRDRSEHLLYAILRGKDWRLAFSPITRPSKIQNGAFSNWGLHHAIWKLKSQLRFWKDGDSMLGGTVTKPMVEGALALMPSVGTFEIPVAYVIREEVQESPKNDDVRVGAA